jgi:hypothetical protein
MLLGRQTAADRIGKLLSEQLIPQLPTQKVRQLLRNGLRRNTFPSAQSQEWGPLQADLQAAMRTNPILIELEVLAALPSSLFGIVVAHHGRIAMPPWRARPKKSRDFTATGSGLREQECLCPLSAAHRTTGIGLDASSMNRRIEVGQSNPVTQIG